MKYASILASAVCALALSGAAAQAGSKDIVGTWLATYDGGVHVGYIQWQKGGTVLNEMDFAPKIGNILIGDWKANDDGSLGFTVFGWTYDDKGKARNGYFTKSETDTVSGSTYSGSFHVLYYDLDGNVVFDHTGGVTAMRMSAP
jgi:hypothetical protein